MNIQQRFFNTFYNATVIAWFFILTGCTSFSKHSDIYEESLTAADKNEYHITISSRLEKTGLAFSEKKANETCVRHNKRRYQILQQDIKYISIEKTNHPSAYFLIHTHIRCK